jgi:hypothetical protein
VREAVFGLSLDIEDKGAVTHYGCEENAVAKAREVGGQVVGLYAVIEPPRPREQCRMVGFPLRIERYHQRVEIVINNPAPVAEQVDLLRRIFEELKDPPGELA